MQIMRVMMNTNIFQSGTSCWWLIPCVPCIVWCSLRTLSPSTWPTRPHSPSTSVCWPPAGRSRSWCGRPWSEKRKYLTRARWKIFEWLPRLAPVMSWPSQVTMSHAKIENMKNIWGEVWGNPGLVTWHGVIHVWQQRHVVTWPRLTDVLIHDHHGDTVLVSLECPGAVLHVVHPASHCQVSGAGVEWLGGHNDLEDHSCVTFKCLQKQVLFESEIVKSFCDLLSLSFIFFFSF